MLPKPERALSKLRGVNAVFGAGAGGGAGAAGLDTPHPEGDEVAAELPSLVRMQLLHISTGHWDVWIWDV